MIQTLSLDTGGVGMVVGRAGVWLEVEEVPRIGGDKGKMGGGISSWQ